MELPITLSLMEGRARGLYWGLRGCMHGPPCVLILQIRIRWNSLDGVIARCARRICLAWSQRISDGHQFGINWMFIHKAWAMHCRHGGNRGQQDRLSNITHEEVMKTRDCIQNKEMQARVDSMRRLFFNRIPEHIFGVLGTGTLTFDASVWYEKFEH